MSWFGDSFSAGSYDSAGLQLFGNDPYAGSLLGNDYQQQQDQQPQSQHMTPTQSNQQSPLLANFDLAGVTGNQNGPSRTSSPLYSVAPVVPTKRMHDATDAFPRQRNISNPSAILSRSQTPQQQQQQQPQSPQLQQQQLLYQHLQDKSLSGLNPQQLQQQQQQFAGEFPVTSAPQPNAQQAVASPTMFNSAAPPALQNIYAQGGSMGGMNGNGLANAKMMTLLALQQQHAQQQQNQPQAPPQQQNMQTLQNLQNQLAGLNPQQLRLLQAQAQAQAQAHAVQQQQQQNQQSSPSPSTLRASPAMSQMNMTPQQLFLQQQQAQSQNQQPQQSPIMNATQLFMQQKAQQQMAQQQKQSPQGQKQYQNKLQQFQQFQQQQQQQMQQQRSSAAANANANANTSPTVPPTSRPGSSGFAMPQTSGPQNNAGMPAHPPSSTNMSGTTATKPSNSPDQFMRTLLEFMHKRGTPITSHPFVGGRVVPLPLLYAVVMKSGGSAKLNAGGMTGPAQTQQKNWYTAAAALGFNLNDVPDAPQQLAQAYQRYLQPFEEWWITSPQHQQQLRLLQAQQQQQHQQQPQQQSQQQHAMLLQQQHQHQQQLQQQPQQQMMLQQQQSQDMSQNMLMQTPMMTQAPSATSASMSPQQLQQQLQSPLVQHQSPMLQPPRVSPIANAATPAQVSRVKPPMPMGSPPPPMPPGTPSSAARQPQPQPLRNRNRNRQKSTHPALRNIVPPTPPTPQVQAPIPPLVPPNSVAPQAPVAHGTPPQVAPPVIPPQSQAPAQPSVSAQAPQSAMSASPSQETVSYVPKTRRLDLHGGFNVSILAGLGDEMEAVRGDFPLLQELGEINLHAVIMSLRSLIPGELKVALDALLLISVEQHLYIPIAECEELVDALVDVGEDCVQQIDKVDFADVKSSDMNLVEFDAYETMVAATRDEFEGFATPLKPGSAMLKLQTLSDRLSAVTTILRNLSFYEHNQPFLAIYETAYGFVMKIVKELCNCGLLTRKVTAVARLALVKDTIVVLSNIAHEVRLRSSDEAKWMIALLSAFAPIDTVAKETTDEGKQKLNKVWAPYVPFKHRYLALAVDVLGKLLARESPNLTYLRTELIPATPATAKTAARNLKKMLQLCMCTFPRLTDSQLLPRAFEVRRPVLEQSMFAAEVLAKAVMASDIPTTCNGPMQDMLEETVLALDECVKPFLARAATVLQGFVAAPPPSVHGRLGNNTTAAAAAAAAALQASSGDVNPFARVVRKATSVLSMLRAAASGEAIAKSADVMLEVLVLRM
ncbi:hypothetical protein V1506DRAFT_451350 [Lipomyces tetrasporus]